MKTAIDICVAGAILMCAAAAPQPPQPALRKGVSVRMPVAGHAAEMRAADQADATVVAITAEGGVFNGITPTEPGALGALAAETVYLKADARAPFQKVLAVLDALRGKTVVLLAAPPANLPKGQMVPPYGIKLTVSR